MKLSKFVKLFILQNKSGYKSINLTPVREIKDLIIKQIKNCNLYLFENASYKPLEKELCPYLSTSI